MRPWVGYNWPFGNHPQVMWNREILARWYGVGWVHSLAYGRTVIASWASDSGGTSAYVVNLRGGLEKKSPKVIRMSRFGAYSKLKVAG